MARERGHDRLVLLERVGGRRGGERYRIILDRRHGLEIERPLRHGPDHEREYEHREYDCVDVDPHGKYAG